MQLFPIISTMLDEQIGDWVRGSGIVLNKTIVRPVLSSVRSGGHHSPHRTSSSVQMRQLIVFVVMMYIAALMCPLRFFFACPVWRK